MAEGPPGEGARGLPEATLRELRAGEAAASGSPGTDPRSPLCSALNIKRCVQGPQEKGVAWLQPAALTVAPGGQPASLWTFSFPLSDKKLMFHPNSPGSALAIPEVPSVSDTKCRFPPARHGLSHHHSNIYYLESGLGGRQSKKPTL